MGGKRRRPIVGVIGTRGLPGLQGGVEKHCEELYPRLAASGVRVVVFSRAPYVSDRPRWSRWRGVLLRKVGAPRRPRLEAIWHSFAGLLLARRYRVAVLHVHAIGPGLLVPLARLLGFRVVFTHHGFDYNRRKWGPVARAVLRLGEWCAATWADETLAVSREIRDSLARRFRCVARLTPNGVLVDEAHVRADAMLLSAVAVREDEYAITVARLVPEKGWDLLFRAAEAVPVIPAVLGVGADDHGSAYAQKLVASAPDKVRLLGTRPHDFTLGLVRAARVFVLPSYHEGLPIALLEAMALGRVVVASDIAPHREIIRHGENGFLFRTGDADGLAMVLVQAWELEAARRASIGSAARETVARQYDWRAAVGAVLDAYRTVGLPGGDRF